MTKTQIILDYELTFDAAFHMGTGLRNGLIHRAVAKDPDGFLFVPGSSIKGVLRDQCARIAQLFDLPRDNPHGEDLHEAHPQTTLVAAVFGSRFNPGGLCFDDLPLHPKDRELFETYYQDAIIARERRGQFLSWQTEKRTQVSIYRPTRTAATGFLYNSEYGIRGLRFNGGITGFLQPPPYGDLPGGYALMLLLAGLLSLDHLGANKSAGAGSVICVIQKLTVDGTAVAPTDIIDRLPEILDYAAQIQAEKEADK